MVQFRVLMSLNEAWNEGTIRKFSLNKSTKGQGVDSLLSKIHRFLKTSKENVILNVLETF